jgi:hypothetical protein
MVRDKHRQLLGSLISGCWRTAPDPVSSLIKKLGEEYSELVENRDPAELHDIADVVNELIVLMDPTLEKAEAHITKQERLGFFARHLEWHPLPDATEYDDPDFAGQKMGEDRG